MKSNSLTNSACAAAIVGLCLTAGARQAHAAALDLPDVPLFLQSGVAPNLLLTLDDSGSMTRDYIPDTIDRSAMSNEIPFYSPHFNGMAYDPSVTYIPPVNSLGQPFTTSFTAAYENGFDTNSNTRNLETNYLDTDVHVSSAHNNNGEIDHAFYAVWDDSNQNCDSSNDTDNDCYDMEQVPSDQEQNFANWYSFYRTRNLTTITGTTLAFADFGGGIRVGWQRLNDQLPNSNEYIQGVRDFEGTHRDNFYEWVVDLEPVGNTPLREAMQRAGEYYQSKEPYLNNPEDSSSESAACRQSYHILMTDGIWNGNLSPEVGNVDDSDHTLPDGTAYTPGPPFEDDTSNTVADLAFLYWLTDLQPNLDDIVPAYMPYQSGEATENYWNPRNDPATWQHMVTYTVSLGLGNTLKDPDWGGSTFAGDYAEIKAGNKAWPGVGKNDDDNAYDLWHAAINSRAEFFSADSPKSLANAFETILTRVSDRTASGSSVALESGSLAGGDSIYAAQFNSESWTGRVISYGLQADGQISGILWDAACALDGGTCEADGESYSGKTESSRRIVTWNPASDTGVPFAWSELSTAQQTALNGDGLGTSRLLYLRGDRANEQANGGDFRNRTSLLGDIVNSSPVYVGAPTRFYAFDWDDRRTNGNDDTPEDSAAVSYQQFKRNHADRPGVVYIGANDGMLHAFYADVDDSNTGRRGGEELFAYVPNAVFEQLPELSKPDYPHRFYVDGTPTEADVFFGGAWHTVLVGGLRAGGQAIYALDVTTVPSNGTSESAIADKVLWEFSDRDDDPNDKVKTGDAELGYTYSEPQVARLHNGEWAVIFGNGYNNTEADGSPSTTGHAVLYVVDIADGSLIAKIDTGVGSTSSPNGLATVTTADVDGDLIVDYVYAGDLLGNLWKFDLRSSDPTKWSVAYGNPIFQAIGPQGQAQPITSQPSIRRHPTGEGYLVIFGTGKYLETTDAKAKTTVQSVYGIWDRDQSTLTAFTRTHMLEQVIERELTLNDSEWRVVSDKPMYWYTGSGLPTTNSDTDPDNDLYLGWYLDLKVDGGTALGEMQITDTLISGDRLIFTTLIPNDDPCGEGGSGWLMVLDYKNGSRFEDISVFDVNGDGLFDLGDYTENATDGEPDVSLSGTKNGTGIPQDPVLGSGGETDTVYIGPKSDDPNPLECKGKDCRMVNRHPGQWNRQSWRQMR